MKLILILLLSLTSLEVNAKKYILTGGPGVGKTTLINYLESELNMHVVREAATDLIALDLALGVTEPYQKPGFNKRVLALQKLRESRVNSFDGEIFFDRSPVDIVTYEQLGGSVDLEIFSAAKEATRQYENTVFLIENLGKCDRNEIRVEDLEETLLLEKLQEENYTRFGFKVVKIPRGTVEERAQIILKHIQ